MQQTVRCLEVVEVSFLAVMIVVVICGCVTYVTSQLLPSVKTVTAGVRVGN